MVMTGEWILALFYPHHNIIHTERPFLKVNLSHLMVKQTGGRETWVHRLQAAVEGEIVPFEQPWGSGTDPWNMDCAVEGKFHILVVSKWVNFVDFLMNWSEFRRPSANQHGYPKPFVFPLVSHQTDDFGLGSDGSGRRSQPTREDSVSTGSMLLPLTSDVMKHGMQWDNTTIYI